MASSKSVRVILVGILAYAVGKHVLDLEIESNRRVHDILSELVAKYPALKKIAETLPVITFYVNGKESRLDETVKPGDEVVIAPPFYEGG